MTKSSLALLVPVVLAALTASEPRAQAIETELFGVRLGARYAETKAALTKKYGAPFQSVADEGDTHDSFRVDPKADTVLTILTRPAVAKYVGAIQLSGTSVLPDFNFIGALNLGYDELAVHIGYPLPVSVEKVTDGYVHYELPDSNLSIETKNGRVASLMITSQSPASAIENPKDGTLTVMSFNQSRTMLEAAADKFPGVQPLPEKESDALMVHATTDALRPLCAYRHPIRWDGTWFGIDVNVVPSAFNPPGPAVSPSWIHAILKTAKAGRFVMDTGFRYTTITTAFCKKIGCKLTKAPKRNAEGKGTGGIVLIGTNAVRLDTFDVSDATVPEGSRLDGALGRDVLLAYPLVLNLRDEYLCYPKTTVADLAAKIDLAPVASPFDDEITLPVIVNGKSVSGAFLDTGSDKTSFYAKDIAALKLKTVAVGPKIRDSHTMESHHTKMKLFGPARVEITAASRRFGRGLESIAEVPPHLGLHKVGNDILHGLTIGLDGQAKKLFIGD